MEEQRRAPYLLLNCIVNIFFSRPLCSYLTRYKSSLFLPWTPPPVQIYPFSILFQICPLAFGLDWIGLFYGLLCALVHDPWPGGMGGCGVGPETFSSPCVATPARGASEHRDAGGLALMPSSLYWMMVHLASPKTRCCTGHSGFPWRGGV